MAEEGQRTVKKSEAKRSYRRYSLDQFKKIYCLVLAEEKIEKEAALITGINVGTGQRYNDKEERRLPLSASHRKLKAGHMRKFVSYRLH
jgi:hypothetical protein